MDGTEVRSKLPVPVLALLREYMAWRGTKNVSGAVREILRDFLMEWKNSQK